MATSTTLIPTTAFGTAVGNYDGSSTSFNSDKTKGDGYRGFTDGLHTISYQVSEFTGTIKIQATLEREPTESDWITVNLLSADGSYTVDTSGLASLQEETELDFTSGTNTESGIRNIKGNFVWVRARIEDFTAGTVNFISLAH